MDKENMRAAQAVSQAGRSLQLFIDAASPRFAKGGRLIYIGAGTSGRLGVLDAAECPPTFQTDPERVVGIIAGGEPALRRSSEGAEDNPEGARRKLKQLGVNDSDILLGIAAGGTTPYVLGALRIAKEYASACLTGLITCAPVNNCDWADIIIYLPTGPEIITGSTRLKAGTATKMALNAISTAIMVRTGRVYRNLMVDLRATNDKLRDRAIRIIKEITGLNRMKAFYLLREAEGDVKTAVVMHRLGLSIEEARKALAECQGRLDAVIDNEREGE